MKTRVFYLLAFAVLMTGSSFAQETTEDDGIEWMTFEEAMEANEEAPKKWFIDMYTDWCGWCKRMDATTFQDSLIVDYINENYYAVKFDAERKDDIIVGDSTYSFVAKGRRGYHELAALMMGGRLSYPTYVFLNPNLQVLTSVPGYKEKREMLPILEYCLAYNVDSNPVDYRTFIQSYQSPYGTEASEETED